MTMLGPAGVPHISGGTQIRYSSRDGPGAACRRRLIALVSTHGRVVAGTTASVSTHGPVVSGTTAPHPVGSLSRDAGIRAALREQATCTLPGGVDPAPCGSPPPTVRVSS
ncbi:hypothetical protein [Actinoplanes utahensis]|uniref:Uncharacterized protein n=1 Tax=Actinoplanes utahensis TaxID=1869 RepID=A0A0A6UNC4_ACTUT|nr:hypothetical protein [Actinoplanes utahensis]KHD76916.1 hypothetical protein MB27_13975 [Actinoplanes utahensis]GIF27329.1 hypothetical protein Aut01nite_03150 [Actinoplanes utahensis]